MRRWVILPLLAAFTGFILGGTFVASKQIALTQGERAAQARYEASQQQNDDSVFARFWHWTTHDPVAFYTSVLAIFTGILGGSTIALWWETRSAGERQGADTRILQRAYIAVELAGINPYRRLEGRGDGKHIVIGHVSIENAGNLPARGISCAVKIGYGPNDVRRDFPIAEDDFFPTRDSGSFILPPKGKMRHGTDSLDLLPEGWVYVWGEIRYHDGFKESPPRFTRFCHRYPRVMLENMGNGYGISIQHGRYHLSGNSTDEDAA